MSKFSLLLTDICLWEASIKSQVGFAWLLSSGNAIPGVGDYTSTAGHPLPGRGLGRGREAPAGYGLHADNTKYWCQVEWVFGLTAVWAHPCQAHHHTLEETAHKLLLLADDGPDWPYTFLWMNDTVSHVSLPIKGHISIMTDDMPSTNACSQLHQL